MNVKQDFESFLDNLKIKDAETISKRYGSITRRLNMYFRNTEDRQKNSFQAGSYGRYSGINGISDLDMLYIMPPATWDTYKDNHAGLIDACKREISKTYPDTELKRDRNVVVVTFTNFVIEVVPVFEQKNGTFLYPDTYNGGSWRKCDTRAEKQTFKEKNDDCNGNLRKIAKMTRAWRAKNDIEMSGFLIDTLCYKFFNSNSSYDTAGYSSYDNLVKDFFKFLSEEPDQKYYIAMGSGFQVKVSKSFKKTATKALESIEEAIEAREKGYEHTCNKNFKKVFGATFPSRVVIAESATSEMFIENTHVVNLTNEIEIECEIKDNLITKLLSRLSANNLRVDHQQDLNFHIKRSDISGNYDLKWKVLNQGEIADQKNDHRGQIMDDAGYRRRKETASFYGDHIVECYAIQNGIVIARDRIIVPIA